MAVRRFFTILGAVALSSAFAFAQAPAPSSVPRQMQGAQAPMQFEPLTVQTRAGKVHSFQVESAVTPDQRAKGLMFRRTMGANQGMIFEFTPEQDVMMWMKNTYIPLDMLFIKADGTVHHIAESTTPFSEATISSNGKVSYVLELNGGTSQRLSLAAGDKVEHRLIRK